MNIDATLGKPAFVPVNIKLESVEELAFFRDVLGRTNSRLASAYGISNDTFNDAYTALSHQCDIQQAPAYMSKGFNINYEKRNAE